MKEKTTAGILALLLGGIGAHKFYLNQTGLGILYLLFCWTFVPAVIGFIEGIVYLTMPDSDWHAKYNAGMTAPAPVSPVITPGTGTSSSGGRGVAAELNELKALRDSGDLTEEQYQAQKRRLLERGA